MGFVLAFMVGYVVGARAGQEGYDEVVDSAKAVRDSDEFRGLVSALRSHASATLQDLSIKISEEGEDRLSMQDVMERMKGWVKPVQTSGGS